MVQFEEAVAINQDKEDLKELLKMRFGSVNQMIIEKVNALDNLDKLGRLILVAANADSLNTFMEELDENEGTFKIIGERFNPLGQSK